MQGDVLELPGTAISNISLSLTASVGTNSNFVYNFPYVTDDIINMPTGASAALAQPG